ncbi:unnamed protein product, partial [Urochloa humidicola]
VTRVAASVSVCRPVAVTVSVPCHAASVPMTDHRAAKLDTTTSRDLGTATQDRMWSLLRLFDLDAEPQFVVPDIVVLIMHWLGAISSWCGP